MYAAVNGYSSIVDLLSTPLKIENTRYQENSPLSNVHVTDRFGRNALHWLVRQFGIGSQRGRDISSSRIYEDDDENMTSRSDGVPEGLKMIKKLLDLEVSQDHRDVEGKSAYDMALECVKRGGVHEQIVKVMLWYRRKDEKSSGFMSARSTIDIDSILKQM